MDASDSLPRIVLGGLFPAVAGLVLVPFIGAPGPFACGEAGQEAAAAGFHGSRLLVATIGVVAAAGLGIALAVERGRLVGRSPAGNPLLVAAGLLVLLLVGFAVNPLAVLMAPGALAALVAQPGAFVGALAAAVGTSVLLARGAPEPDDEPEARARWCTSASAAFGALFLFGVGLAAGALTGFAPVVC